MGLGEILDGAFKLLRADLGPLLLAVAAVVIPTQLLLAFTQYEFQTSLFDNLTFSEGSPAADEAFLRDVFAEVLPVVGVTLLQGLLLLLAGAAVARIGAARYLGQAERPLQALATAGRRAPALVAAALVRVLAAALPVVAAAAMLGAAAATEQVAIAVIGGLLLLPALAFALWIYISLALTVPIMMVEGSGPLRSLGRSARLVRGRWWPTFGTLLVAGIVLSIVAAALGGIPSILGALFPLEVIGVVFGTVGAIIGSLLTQPVSMLIKTLLYFDERVRKEGLDLQLRGDFPTA